jgi:23S rRNA (guanosine2251-2'-O)-methyltransferase
MLSPSTICGRFPVLACLQAGKRQLYRLTLQQGTERSETLDMIKHLAATHDIPMRELDRQQLERLYELEGENHQGTVLEVSDYPYLKLEILLDRISTSGRKALVLILDHIQDPHNVGALIRSAEIAGCQGVIIPKDRSCEITSTVVKTSAGATEYCDIIRVTNLNQTIKQLKKAGIWIVGLEEGGQSVYELDLSIPLALIVGSEGKGVSKLTLSACDFLAQIPMYGHTPSLNASVAGGIALFEVVRQRNSAR